MSEHTNESTPPHDGPDAVSSRETIRRESTRRDTLRAGLAVAAGVALGLGPAACAPRGRVYSRPPLPGDPVVRPIDGVDDRVLRPAAVSPAIIARSEWATTGPNTRLADRMAPITHITVHHDGMNTFTSGARSAAANRLESIRRAHRSRGWADIGYHYAVDPAGRVWAGRSMSLQGAHVRDHNRGNIGVLVMGNYENQAPTASTVSALTTLLASLRDTHGVPQSRVRTHREWAPTACPGRTLQPIMDRIRTTVA